ncbi:hypothetical protein ACSBR2_040527 [Camellia fascicularis]
MLNFMARRSEFEEFFDCGSGRECCSEAARLSESNGFSSEFLNSASKLLQRYIPEELTSLLGLRLINLSRDHLTGMIPKKIGDMQLLESVDLSRNQLFGETPPSMSGFAFLNHLDLSLQ